MMRYGKHIGDFVKYAVIGDTEEVVTVVDFITAILDSSTTAVSRLFIWKLSNGSG